MTPELYPIPAALASVPSYFANQGGPHISSPVPVTPVEWHAPHQPSGEPYSDDVHYNPHAEAFDRIFRREHRGDYAEDDRKPRRGPVWSSWDRAILTPNFPKQFPQGDVRKMVAMLREKWRSRLEEMRLLALERRPEDFRYTLEANWRDKLAMQYRRNCPSSRFEHFGRDGRVCQLAICPFCHGRKLLDLEDRIRNVCRSFSGGLRQDVYIMTSSHVTTFRGEKVLDQVVKHVKEKGWSRELDVVAAAIGQYKIRQFVLSYRDGASQCRLLERSLAIVYNHVSPPQGWGPHGNYHTYSRLDHDKIAAAAGCTMRYREAYLDHRQFAAHYALGVLNAIRRNKLHMSCMYGLLKVAK